MYIVFSVFDVNKNNDVMTMMVMIMTIIITVIMIIIYTIIKISENAAFRSNNRNAVFCFQRETVRCETGLIFSSLHV